MDSKLPFNTHVDEIVMKVKSTRSFIARNTGRCIRKVKQAAYTTYITPIVKYALPLLVTRALSATPAIFRWIKARVPAMSLAALFALAVCLPCSTPTMHASIRRWMAPKPPAYDATHTSHPPRHPLAVPSYTSPILNSRSQLQTICAILGVPCLCFILFS